MPTIPAKVLERLVTTLKRFQPIISSAKARDVNESDTSIIVTDLLSEIFGYDKYSEVTSEHAIKGTFCDLAVHVEGKALFLVEVKAIGLELKDAHVKQAVDYAANKGIDWVILTNGAIWKTYKISFCKPIDQELVYEFDFLTLNPKSEEDLSALFLLCKEAWTKQALVDFHEQRQALSRFCIAAMVLSDSVLDVLRRELRRMCPDVKIQNEQIQNVLLTEVLKRECIEGEKAEDAKRKVARAATRLLRNKAEKQAAATVPEIAPAAVPALTAVSAQATPATAGDAPTAT
jgi:predicted type IV restriction endonuclease